ncbi:MAG: hypothetical protein WAN60_20065 [Candidatus Sulfotelmatobacter sp.]
MKKAMAVSLLVVTMTLCFGVKLVQAQDDAKPVHAYRLDFSLNELEGEKRINTRHYSINLNVPGDRQEVKIGTRVPVATASFPASASSGSTVSPVVNTEFQYLDVGTHIWCALKEHGDELELNAGSEISNVDDEPARDKYGVSAPVIRQIKISGSTVVIPGKPIVIGSADDPTSNRQFQLEVTVTKLR